MRQYNNNKNGKPWRNKMINRLTMTALNAQVAKFFETRKKQQISFTGEKYNKQPRLLPHNDINVPTQKIKEDDTFLLTKDNKILTV